MTVDSLIESEVKEAIQKLRDAESRFRELAVVAETANRETWAYTLENIQRRAEASARVIARYLERFRKKEDGT